MATIILALILMVYSSTGKVRVAPKKSKRELRGHPSLINEPMGLKQQSTVLCSVNG